MKYAVIKLQGRQFKVKEGEEILVDKLIDQKVCPEVLLVVDDKEVKIGRPIVKNAKIKIKVVGEEKGEKISVRKYKAKSRYRRKMGFRPQYTRLLIEKIL